MDGEVNLFDIPWPKDLVKPRRTLGEALGNIAEAELDDQVEIGLETVENAFETYVVMSLKTSDGRSADAPLTRPKAPEIAVSEDVSQVELANLMEADLRELCGRLK